jgi:hypothetical protein
MTHTIVVISYVLILIGVAVYKSRTVKSADDFMIAGRSVPVYMLVATLVCTWIGSGSLFGTAGLTFRTGVSELWFSAGAWVGILVVYMIAARVRRIAQYTLTDLLEKRYSQAAKVLGTITIIIAYMVIAGYQFKGGGRFIAILSEGAITPDEGMLIACVLIVGFTVLAGMVSIVSIDIFNGTVMLLAMIVTLPFAISTHGGIDAVIATIDATAPSHLSLFGGHDFFWVVGIALPTFLLLMSESSMYQKFSSADNAANAKKAVLGMFVGVVIVELLMMLIALVGFAIYADDPRFFLADGDGGRDHPAHRLRTIADDHRFAVACRRRRYHHLDWQYLPDGDLDKRNEGYFPGILFQKRESETNYRHTARHHYWHWRTRIPVDEPVRDHPRDGADLLHDDWCIARASVTGRVFLEAREPRWRCGIHRVRHADGNRHHRDEFDIQGQCGWRAGTGRFIPDGHGLHRDSRSDRLGTYVNTRQPGDSQTR